jgi:aminopeptidase
MPDSRVAKMAETIARYSLSLKPGEQVLVLASVPALPLVREFYAAALSAGALPFLRTFNPELDEVLYRYGSDEQLRFVPASDRLDIETCAARLAIRGDENLATLAGADPARLAIGRKARKPLMDIFMERKGRGVLKSCLTQYPTNASAQEAGMSLAAYADFVFAACFVDQPDPIASWKRLSAEQQRYVDFLNKVKTLKVEGPGMDLTLSVEGRKWVNSDGKANFPSGEVFTGPVEDSAEGRIAFDVPTLFTGHPVEGIELEFHGGRVVKASAARGNDMLQSALDTDERSRYLGEFAFGLNYGITRPTRNILFDEKIGGSIHAAIGAGYPETGSTNRSGIHWDMIKDMKQGRVYADGKLVYEDGRFTV